MGLVRLWVILFFSYSSARLYKPRLNFIINIPLRRILLRYNRGGIPHNDAVVGHIEIYIAVGGYQYIITDGNATHNDGIGPHPYFIADDRCANVFATIGLPDGNALVDIAVFADARSRV